eukprot:TRINITY_DN344_c0_g1_i4.p1 TRINITY_DN344_c0_g1~~TRINITY_DN344_c0_g1_i4.p1  ORF type:complete len:223 (+),score=67.98 TRINITY_DN344_c0_g1_i4:56-670(+)
MQTAARVVAWGALVRQQQLLLLAMQGQMPPVDAAAAQEQLMVWQQIQAEQMQQMHALQTQQLEAQAELRPLPATRGPKGRGRRKPKQPRADEKRVDPTDGRRYTQREFLMRHAVGADFSKGDALWADAGRALAAVQPVRRPRAKASRPAAAPRVRFSEVLDVVECSSEAAAAAPSFARPAKSVLKSRSATPAPVSDCFADALTA